MPREERKLGLLVLTNTKEQSAEIYKQIRLSDTEGKLKVSRLGSISFVAPRLDVNSVLCKKNVMQSNETSVNNLIKVAESEELDVLIATPLQLSILSPMSNVFRPHFAVFQDFELMFDGPDRLTERVLTSLDPESKQIWATRHIAPEIPNNAIRWLPQDMPVDGSLQTVPQNGQEFKFTCSSYKNKVGKLLDTIKKNSSKRGVVFCKDANEVSELSQILSRNQIKSAPYLIGPQTPPSLWNLMKFKTNRAKVLLCEEKAIRSLDAKEAEFAVWLHEPSSTNAEYYRRRSVAPEAAIIRLIDV